MEDAGHISESIGDKKTGFFDDANRAFERPVEMNRSSRFGGICNEWSLGLSGKPVGFPGQSWSAGMYLYCLDAITNERPGALQRCGWMVKRGAPPWLITGI